MLVFPISKILLYRNNQLAVKIAIMFFSRFFQVFNQMFRYANRCFYQFLFRTHMVIISTMPLYPQGCTHARRRCKLRAIRKHLAIQVLALFSFMSHNSRFTVVSYLKISSFSVGERYIVVLPSYSSPSLYLSMAIFSACVSCFPLQKNDCNSAIMVLWGFFNSNNQQQKNEHGGY